MCVCLYARKESVRTGANRCEPVRIKYRTRAMLQCMILLSYSLLLYILKHLKLSKVQDPSAALAAACGSAKGSQLGISFQMWLHKSKPAKENATRSKEQTLSKRYLVKKTSS